MSPGRYPLPAIHLGWQVVDPGPAPQSSLINAVPDTPDPAAHARWRQRVEDENASLLQQHQCRPVWFPVQRDRHEYVIPFFGGRPATWQSCLATLTAALIRSGFLRVRVVNLSRHRVLDELHQLSAHPRTPWTTECQVLSSRGSTVDAVPAVGLDDIVGAITDLAAADQAANGMRAANLRAALVDVGQCLSEPVRLDALGQAVRLVVTGTAPAGATFTKAEEQALRSLHGQLQHRPASRNDLDELERLIAVLLTYRRGAGQARRLGSGEVKVRTLELDGAAHGPDRASGGSSRRPWSCGASPARRRPAPRR